MITVLHIVLGLQVGGLEKFVLDLIRNYSPEIVPVIVCLEGKGELGLHYDKVPIIALNKEPGIRWSLVGKLAHLVRAHHIDIIHTHNAGPHFYGALAGMLTRRPVIHTKHGRNHPTDRMKVLLNRLSSLLTRKVIAVSQNAADVCLQVEKVAPSKVAVILNGIDTELYRPKERDGFVRGGTVKIGIVARLAEVKDHHTLLQACRLLTAKHETFHLDIFGDGPLRKMLEESAHTLGIGSYVSFCGVRHDVPSLLRELDIFVLSSTSEGISLTLLEAMATGLPIVATNVGGNPEVIVDGETGYLVPPQNPEAMADKLLVLIHDEKIRQYMGEKGRERVIAQFSIKETARKYEELYFSVLSKG